jgi:Ni/Co efflux regulator RcnB
MKTLSIGILAAFALAATVGIAEAKDNKGKSKGPDKSKIEKSVKTNKGVGVPPGQIKRYTRGQKIPNDLDIDYLDDLDGWKLKPLPAGQRYIRVDDEILSISDDTKTVIDAVGIVSDLVN